ncbi:uncharacterized protein LOC133813440 [Humulus lupulus]|uniref:uncharacterized protein LOC133813440 n=1 Tax=Humulus lupulus TaxID=3486 RepID=UPI002B40F8A0|nr:uncharacterized protein LOC133813440 [Humulus lupulus]
MGVSDDAIRLSSINTWEELAQKLLAKFFPPAKVARLRGEINNFLQNDGESLYDVWERFKELLRKCPHHGIEKWMLVHNFYNRLCGTTRTIIDVVAGGDFMSKNAIESYELLEEMAMNNYQWPAEGERNKKVVGVHELDAITALTAQVATLTKQLQQNTISANAIRLQIGCEICGGPHQFEQCMTTKFNNTILLEQVSMMGNFNRQANNPFSNSFNPGWRNHPNFSWRNNQGQQPQFQPQSQQIMPQPLAPPILEEKANELQAALLTLTNPQALFMTETRSSIRNLEMQVGQLENLLQIRSQGNFPSNTEVNPKEHCNAISLRSGKELEKSIGKSGLQPKMDCEKEGKVEEKVTERATHQ